MSSDKSPGLYLIEQSDIDAINDMREQLQRVLADIPAVRANIADLVAERDALREGVARLEQNAEHFADKYAEAASEVEALSFRCRRMEAALVQFATAWNWRTVQEDGSDSVFGRPLAWVGRDKRDAVTDPRQIAMEALGE